MKYEVVVTLPQKLSLNQYHTTNRYKLHSIKQDFYQAVQFAERSGSMPKPPFKTSYHFLLYGAQMDTSNLVGMVKPLEDGLVRMNIFEDDNHNIVKEIVLTQGRLKDDKKKKISYCIITIEPWQTNHKSASLK